jgi:putative two-component system response regulator
VDTAGDPILTSRILIVDDEPYNVTAIGKYLRDEGYTQVATLSDSSNALGVIADEQPDLLLLDIVMPQVSGLEILRALRADVDADHLPVLMLASAADGPIRRNALALGATDFLAKPVDATDLVPRTRNALLAGAQKRRLASQAEEMEREVRKRTAELATSRQEVIRCLALAAEYRDDDTGHHIMRVGRFAGIIARQLGFEEGRVEILELAAQLHDVGKIGIPDSILKTPGKLDPEQLAIMQKHSSIAKRILTPMVEQEWQLLKTHSQVGATLLGIRTSPLLMLAAKIAQTHHERWDGTGYPLGLAGKDIPIEGRITAVADVFDALSSRRCYKEPFPREKCFAILQEGRGTHFDPEILDAFFARSEDVVRVQLEFMDIA